FRDTPTGTTKTLAARQIQELTFAASDEIFRSFPFRYRDMEDIEKKEVRLGRVLVNGEASLLLLDLPNNTRLRKFADPVDYLFYLQKGKDFYKLEQITTVTGSQLKEDNRYRSVLAAAMADAPELARQIKTVPYDPEFLSELVLRYNQRNGEAGDALLYSSQQSRSSVTYSVGLVAQPLSFRSDMEAYRFYGLGAYLKFRNAAKSNNNFWGLGVEAAYLQFARNEVALSSVPTAQVPAGTLNVNGTSPLGKVLVSFGRDPLNAKPVEVIYGLRAGLAFVSIEEEAVSVRDDFEFRESTEYGAAAGFLGLEFGVRVQRIQFLVQADRIGFKRENIQAIDSGMDVVLQVRFDLNQP
ncbi:MAG: hypothetical protein AAFZ52_13820, partial [Bacteroidota bacterium]